MPAGAGARDEDSSKHSNCVTQRRILPPGGQRDSHPPSVCDTRPAEPSQNWAIKTGRRWWWDEAVFGINLHPSLSSSLALGWIRSSTGLSQGWRGRKVCRRTLAKTSTAERSHKWQSASGNTDRYAVPKQALTSQHWEVLECQTEKDMTPVTPEACQCLTRALSGSANLKGEKNKMHPPPSRTCKLFGKKTFLKFSHFP